jgi:hypothetical protein
MGENGAALSHWHVLFDDCSTSTQDFYRAVEAAIARRNLPDLEVSRVLFKEAGISSAQREYLRISRRRIAFDICSAPYGNGHFFSWWLARVPARFGLVIAAGVILGSVLLWTLVLYGLAKSGGCVGTFIAVLLFFVGVPGILYGLGALVDNGYLADEEWVLSVPYIGRLYAAFFNPTSYYRLDTAMMFRDTVRSAVNEVINELRTEKGLRALEGEALRPWGAGRESIAATDVTGSR